MSITVVKDKGVTVITMETDSKSLLPLLCQMLKTEQGLMQTNVTAALGTIQIMVGLFNIGLESGRSYMKPDDLTFSGAAYWPGAVFIVAGIMSLLAGRFPSRCLVGVAVLVNIVGSIFAIIDIMQTAIDLAAAPATRMCDGFAEFWTDNCQFVAAYFQRLLMAMDITMIVLAVLQLCVCISFAVLGFNAVVNRKKEEGGKDEEYQQPQLKEVLLTSPGA